MPRTLREPIINGRAIAPAWRALRCGQRRVLFSIIADSNGIRNSGSSKYGWAWHMAEALAAFNSGVLECCASMIAPWGVNNGNNLNPYGYKASHADIADSWATLVSEHAGVPYARSTTNAGGAPYSRSKNGGYQTTSGSAAVEGLLLDADHPIGLDNHLAAYLRYMTFASGGGSHTMVARVGQPPYTVLGTQIISAATGSDGTARASIDLPTGTGGALKLNVLPEGSGTSFTADVCPLWMWAQRLVSDLPGGWAVDAGWQVGSSGYYEYVDDLLATPAALWQAYFADCLEVVGSGGFVVMLHWLGVNDRSDASLDSWTHAPAGVVSSAKCDTGEGMANNFLVSRYLLGQAWAAAGGDPSRLVHGAIPGHQMRITAEHPNMVAFRERMARLALGLDDTFVVDLGHERIGTDAEWMTWWETPGDGYSPGGDGGRSHLLQAGYSSVCSRLISLFNESSARIGASRGRSVGRSRAS